LQSLVNYFCNVLLGIKLHHAL